jgi:hypothetical protein
MVSNRRIAALTIIITVVMVSGLVASGALATATNIGSAGSLQGFSTATHWKQRPGNLTGPPWPENMTRPFWQGNMTRRDWQGNVTVTSEQAQTTVGDAVNAFKIGEVKDGGSVWMVSIKYNDKAVMTVLLGKVNTPTSGDALKAVQDSMGNGWSAGEPKQHGSAYDVPITDANGNVIGNVRVDGRTGDIITGFPPLHM